MRDLAVRYSRIVNSDVAAGIVLGTVALHALAWRWPYFWAGAVAFSFFGVLVIGLALPGAVLRYRRAAR